MKSSQKGFSTLEAVLVLVVVGLIGVGGWLVYARQKDDAKPATNTTQQEAVETTIENTVVSKVPSELQAAILSETEKSAPGCVKNSKIVDASGQPVDNDITYDSNGYAITGIGCDGSSAFLFARIDNRWTVLDHTGEAFQCTILKENKVPVELLEVAFDGQLSPTDCISDDPTPQLETYRG